MKQISMTVYDFENDNFIRINDVPFSTIKYYLKVIYDYIRNQDNENINAVTVEIGEKNYFYAIDYSNNNQVTIKIIK